MKNRQDTKTLVLNNKPLTLQIIRSAARKRSLALTVHSPDHISVRAPLRTSLKMIDTFVSAHQDWLLKKIHEVGQRVHLKNELLMLDSSDYTPAEILATFTARATFWAQQLQVVFKKIGLSDATRRWGSCNADNVIRINSALIKAPLELLDYVIVHELCHVRHKNHSAHFWQFVASVMPDYAERRKKLRGFSPVG